MQLVRDPTSHAICRLNLHLHYKGCHSHLFCSQRRNGGGGESYTCLDGVSVGIGALCDGVVHCHGDGGSDEEVNFCEAWGCGQRAPQADVCDVEECKTGKTHSLQK